MLAFRNVSGLKTDSCDSAVIIKQREPHHQKVAIFTTYAQRLFAFNVLAKPHDFEFTLAKQIGDHRRENLKVCFPHHLPGLKTKTAFKFGVGKLIATAGIFHRHQRYRIGHHGLQAFLILARTFFGFVQRGVIRK